MKKLSILITVLLSALTLTACQSLRSSQSTAHTASSAKQGSSASSAMSSSSQSVATQSDQEAYADLLETYTSQYHSEQYALVDLNQDGQDELLIGDEQFVEALYYLSDGSPKELVRSQVASAGGYRSGLSIYRNGAVLFVEWLSGNGQGTARLYRFSPDGLPGLAREEEIQLPLDSVLPSWGLSEQEKLELSQLEWQGKVQDDDLTAGANGMDLKAILAGDYRSIAGTWQREDGRTITFDDAGLVADGVSIAGIREENGYLTLNVQADGGGGFGIILVPAGQLLSTTYNQDLSDSSRDRLVAGQNLPPTIYTSDFYYRIDD